MESNAAVVVRQPRVTDAVALPGGVLVRLDLDVRDNQRVVLLLDELDPPADRQPFSYQFTASFPLGPAGRPAREVTIDTPLNLAVGRYLVRVQVDGVPSRPGDLDGPAVELGR